MAVNNKMTDAQIQRDKTNHIMQIVAERASFYRANPHRFAKDYLGLNLKLFQKILLFCMMHNDAFYYIAARGQHKGLSKIITDFLLIDDDAE